MHHTIEQALVKTFMDNREEGSMAMMREDEENKTCDKGPQAPEMVNHPDHYQARNGLEVIDVIEAYGLGFNLGNVTKYVLRAEKKFNALEDLKKANWYLEREITNREKLKADSIRKINK